MIYFIIFIIYNIFINFFKIFIININFLFYNFEFCENKYLKKYYNIKKLVKNNINF